MVCTLVKKAYGPNGLYMRKQHMYLSLYMILEHNTRVSRMGRAAQRNKKVVTIVNTKDLPGFQQIFVVALRVIIAIRPRKKNCFSN